MDVPAGEERKEGEERKTKSKVAWRAGGGISRMWLFLG
jgi:hypothetical protein